MAKLIKASTMRKRAETVDKGQVQIDKIAQDIAWVTAQGDTSYSTQVPTAHEEAIIETLTGAGYLVRYPEHEAVLRFFGTEKPQSKRNWFQKLFGLTTEDLNEVYVPMKADRAYEHVVISWGAEAA